MTGYEIVFAVFTAIFFISLISIKRVRELHHGYYGIVISFFAFAWHSYPLLVLAFILLLDDTVQHVEEAFGVRGRMDDFTPIHKLGAWLMSLDLKKTGWLAPIFFIVALFAAAVFFAIREFK